MTKEFLRTDAYGYAASAIAALESFSLLTRGTGRTKRLLDQVKDSDTIVVYNPGTARTFEAKLRAMGKEGVSVLCIDYRTPSAIREALEQRRAGRFRPGRVHFDHAFVEAYLRYALRQLSTELPRLEELYSSTEGEFSQYEHDRALQASYVYEPCD